MVHIIGGGLAGSEAAWQAANLGVPVVLHEMRPVVPTAVHQTDRLAELVCSNEECGYVKQMELEEAAATS